MSSVFYQTLMYLLFCSTWLTAFCAAWINYENIYKTFCVSTILWSTFLFALTEVLSFFTAITASNLLIAWGIFLIIVGGYCLARREILKNKINTLKKTAVSLYSGNGNAVKAMIIFIAFFMIYRTIIAIITAVPYDSDVMAYHLSRIGYWIQHQSVAHFDTFDLRHLRAPVFAEYINLHVFLITGGDLFANMVQNLSAYGCLFLIYGIIRKLGCGIKWALFGCILALSMNNFAGESVTAEVDLAAAFYLMPLTYLIIDVLYQTKLNIFQFVLLGLSSGLIYITKSNACAPAAVIIIYVILVKIFQKNFKIIPLGIISLIFIAAIVSPTFYRNYKTFNGDFMAKGWVGNIAIATSSPKYIFVNVIKNLIHLGFERNKQIINEGMAVLCRRLNVNINDPKIRFGSEPFRFDYSLRFAGAGSAHIVMPLFFITIFISIAYCIKRRTKTDGLMFALILSMFAILIALRWQPWGGGLLLPGCVVAIIPIVYYFSEISKRYNNNSLKYKACFFLALDLIFHCGICSTESLVYYSFLTLRSMKHSRYIQNLGGNPNIEFSKAYINFSRFIDEGKYNKIGVDGTWRFYHHPILARYVPQGKKIECVRLLGNERKAKALNPNYSPDIILVHAIKLDPEKIYTCNGNNYKCIYSLVDEKNIKYDAYYSVWVKE